MAGLCIGACSDSEPQPETPRLINARVFDFPFSADDGGRVLVVQLDLDVAPTCPRDDALPLFGVVIDTTPDDEPAPAEEEVLAGIDPELRITAQCVGDALASSAGDVSTASNEQGVTVSIAVDASELPSELGWLAFVADGDEIQRSPAAPEFMVWRSRVID